jgi:cell division protein FtsI (penicillin-binding protein 3)
MKFSESPVLELRLPVWRSRLMLIAFAGAFFILLGRAVYLQGLNQDFLQAKGASRYSRVLEVPATRGKILDRNGDALAISTPVKSVWAIPEDVKVSSGELKQLAALLDMPQQDLQKRLSATERDFVYLKRQLAPAVAERVAELGIPGINQSDEYRRYYPGGEVMAHVLGFTNTDDVGQEGIELAFQSHLAGKAGSRRVIKDRRGHVVEDIGSITAARDGKDLVLALDSRIQSLAYSQLEAAVTQNRAKSGAIVVADVRTGEVLALANLPTYNPNNRTHLTGAQLRNRAVTDMFEPGSTLKPVTIALALDRGKVTPATIIQTAPGWLTIGSATIHDAHPEGALTVEQVIQRSSNVGSAKIALEMPALAMYEMFEDIGFGAAPHLGFPGEAAGRVRPYKTWRPIEQATMSYGHGITVSLVQLVRAYTVFAHEGLLMPLSLIKRDQPPAGKQVVSRKTADAVRHMLELAVQPGGTAPRAQIMGYRVAGKTGTAHKLADGRYARDKYVSSFVGFAPASNPRLVIAVMIDEPSAGKYYGGQIAAPVFAQVMAGSLRSLGVQPDAPMEPIELPPPGAEIKESI